MSALADLQGKVAVVTGGASGIGRGIATQLRAAGMNVVIADIESGAVQATAADLGLLAIETDVSDHASVQALAEQVIDRFGAVHVVCNNAGVGPAGAISDLTLADWRWIINVNLWGVIHGVNVFLPLLKRNPDGGHIVNTASVGGLRTSPRLGAYCVTKFGVVALSEALAAELEEDDSSVGVSILCPGTVRTNIKASSRNRPAHLRAGALADIDLESEPAFQRNRWMEPEAVGALVVDAIKRGDLYIFTHPEMYSTVEERHREIDAAAAAAAARA